MALITTTEKVTDRQFQTMLETLTKLINTGRSLHEKYCEYTDAYFCECYFGIKYQETMDIRKTLIKNKSFLLEKD